MRLILLCGTALLFVAALAGCDGTTTRTVVLPPAEIFTWTGGQPISFSPPPEDWKRSRYQNGGAEGVNFVKAGSKGEMIYVAERFFLGNRDRCARMQKILHDLDDYDRKNFAREMQKARLYANEPFNSHEERMVEVVNYTLDRASEAYLAGNMAVAREELTLAVEQAGRIRFSIDETVERVLFTAERNSVYPSLQVEEPATGTLAGEPAVVVRFTFNGHGIPMIGIRIYALNNNRLFEVGFQGREATLPLFDAVVGSITFPPGSCEH